MCRHQPQPRESPGKSGLKKCVSYIASKSQDATGSIANQATGGTGFLITRDGRILTERVNIAIRVSGHFTSEESLKAVNFRVNGRFFRLSDI